MKLELVDTPIGEKPCTRCGKIFPIFSSRQKVCITCKKADKEPKAIRKKNKVPTWRQGLIIKKILEGKGTKQAAYELGIGAGTYKVYCSYIYRKFEVENKTQLAILAMSNPVFSEFRPVSN